MRKYWMILFCAGLLVSCEPSFLEQKPDKRLLVPGQLSDYQALLDAVPEGMNTSPGMQALATDDFYCLPVAIDGLPPAERGVYLWERDPFQGKSSQDWDLPYKCIFYANVVLSGLESIQADSASQQQYASIQGSALFFRAFAHYNLAAAFCAPYDSSSASSLPGIPLRLTADVNQISDRGTLQATYDQILSDLSKAEALLTGPVGFTNRPSGVAAKALLARIYLSMGEYGKALIYASKALGLHDKLLDYNTLNASARRPFPAMFTGLNPEIIFHASMPGMDLPILTQTGVDSSLYRSYAPDDLRKTCFFVDRGGGVFGFKGSYLGSATLFAGLATDELYLIRAECYARAGQRTAALSDLNALLKQRFKAGTFKELVAGQDSLLNLVLSERRKQLVARGLRWTDLRRLNKDPALAVRLQRLTSGGAISLLPGDNRYTLPIPDPEIALSGISPNPR
ncbi:SusD family protein [Dyadobacter soli]|uniref:SusD family protein n=1 Tax=Dyadobacter soli TaxID=659014 RepID=A0A1G7MI06_9BACT|nr:RagB/SusD family nutrient uptake outer membrane protein [Dyadobacter soli]SDF61392.1 SusD family protein [Dyadobacter soli]